MATTSSLGIGAGVDLQSLLTKIIAAERAPIDTLNTRIASTNSKITLFGTLNSRLDTFKSAADTLRFPARLSAVGAESSDEKAIKASVSPGTATGSYSVEVINLAAAQKDFSTAYTANTKFSGSTISFELPPGSPAREIALDSGAEYSLDQVRDLINGENLGVTATVVNGSAGARLILTSSETGAQGAFSFSTDLVDVSGTQNPLATLEDASSGLAVSVARDAVIKVDGIEARSKTNDFADVVAGLTFTAIKEGTTSTITVKADATKITDAVKKFIEGYNDVVNLIKTNSNYDLETKKAQGFNADFAARAVLGTLSDTRISVPATLNDAPLKNLFDIGISIDRAGLMTLDSSKLEEAIRQSPGDVTKLLGAYGDTFNTAVSSMQGANGVVGNRVSSLNSSVSSMKDRQASLEFRVSNIEQRYRKQFTALDTLVSRMQTTSSYLAQQLANL